jgi:hypothetical protein
MYRRNCCCYGKVVLKWHWQPTFHQNQHTFCIILKEKFEIRPEVIQREKEIKSWKEANAFKVLLSGMQRYHWRSKLLISKIKMITITFKGSKMSGVFWK